MSARMDINTLGTVFTDYHLLDVGVAAFQLAHDFFIQQDLVIRDAPAGGGNLLVEGVDYTLADEDTELSARVTAAVGAGRNVYRHIAVINAAYQVGDLYFSGKYVADLVEAIDHEARLAVTITGADHTILDDEDVGVLLVDPDGGDRTVTLPTAADNPHRKLYVVNAGPGVGSVIIDGEGAEVIRNGEYDFAQIEMPYPGMSCLLVCDGMMWHKLTPPSWWKVLNPGIDWAHTKTTGWTADRFTAATGGLEADYSPDVPLGTLAVMILLALASTIGAVFVRAAGDPNISNTPVASNEQSCSVIAILGRVRINARLSSARKMEVAVTDTGSDIYLSHPSEILW